MSLDLTLLPIDSPEGMWPAHSHTVLPCFRREDLFAEIASIEPRYPVDDGLTCYLASDPEGETCYGTLTEDRYGQPLRYVRAGDLATLAQYPDVLDNPTNRATWAYLAALDPRHRVALLWC